MMFKMVHYGYILIRQSVNSFTLILYIDIFPTACTLFSAGYFMSTISIKLILLNSSSTWMYKHSSKSPTL